MLTDKTEWKALEAQSPAPISGDFDAMHVTLDGLLFDYSKQDVNAEILNMLMALARACDVEEQRDALFAGDPVNTTEDRPALHTHLRKKNAPPEVQETLARMQAFQAAIWDSDITDVVNIGIGGSDTGPHMVCEALKPFSNRDLNLYFVSNVDGSHLTEALHDLKPETTLFIIASKSFTTDETMSNAASAKEWAGGTAQFVAVTARTAAAREFGIAEENIFPIWDWVGGRFSLWSAMGLPICLALGFDHFRKLLAGAQAMDQHFQSASLEENIPLLSALLGIWQRNFCGRSGLAILPYDQYLHLLPTYLQQLEMESNGKSVDKNGHKIDYPTAPIVFGQAGTNSQHTFYQWLHQGSEIIPCEFIIASKTQNPLEDHHAKLIANAIGQSAALMSGKYNSNAHKNFDGGRPSTTIVLDELDPYHLGMLLALYEHKVFVLGAIWNINSFDQWGVELGKSLAKNIFSGPQDSLDPSSKALLNHIHSEKNR